METSLRLRLITIILFLQFLTLPTLHTNFCTGDSAAQVRCIQSERVALLEFKQDLQDPSHRLASWAVADGDCCQWVGVVCHNVTGHVQELHLRSFRPVYDGSMSDYEWETQLEAYWSSRFGGKINPSLLDLKHLIYLDLSYNNFNGTQIPKFLSSMERLRYLNLSNAGFGGVIPHQLGNLSNLHYLNLEGDIYNNNLYVMNLQWLSGLPLLQHLDMSSVDLSQASNWLPDINKLPSLLELRMSNCYLSGSTPSTPSINFSSLATLDLSYNHFENTSNILWVFGLHNLVSLDLSGNQFQGPIPVDLQNMTSLRHLDLSDNSTLYMSVPFESALLVIKGKVLEYSTTLQLLNIIDLSKNNLSGQIPKEVTSLQGLQSLNLSFNSLNGRIPKNIGDMGSLESIDFSVNQLSGQVPQSMSRLTFLSYLNLSNNHLIGRIPSSTQLQSLNASSFVGNKLCGPPLANKCTINYVKPNTENKRSKDFGGLEVDWFYVSMGLGFGVGFGVVWGPLLMNKHWRFLYFQFLDRLGNKLRGVVS
uniref:Leucine-rich repeat-containing N-terminal plant-type domain-containing protein n=1 Tax=Fagus sylvatica TaxID=28930 RepID=A0A2N9EWM9_FAGSY